MQSFSVLIAIVEIITSFVLSDSGLSIKPFCAAAIYLFDWFTQLSGTWEEGALIEELHQSDRPGASL